MAIINIPPDSDGTIHTAAMHNDKFAVVQNLVNGNIDHSNLKYSQSIVEWGGDSWESHQIGPIPAAGGASTVRTIGLADSRFDTGIAGAKDSYNDLVNGSNHFTNSIRRTNAAAYRIQSCDVWFQSFHWTAGYTWTLILEYANSLDPVISNWTTVASGTLLVPGAPTSVPVQLVVSVTNANVPASKWFRVRLVNIGDGSGTYNVVASGPDVPEVHVRMTAKTIHVA